LPRLFRSLALPAALAALFAIALTAGAGSSGDVPVVEDPAFIGRLAGVETATGRLTLVPDGQTTMVDLILDAEGRIWKASRELSLAELAAQISSRIKVRYHLDAGRRIARSVTVERPADQ